MARALNSDLAHSFQLSNKLKLDPELRAEAEKMSVAHLARIKQLLPGWVQEERRLQAGANGKANSTAVYYAVSAHLLNELALWQVEPGDAAYEQATLEVLKTSPLACRTAGDTRYHDFSSRIMRVQFMPPERRAAALATERELLEHWGKPRSAVQPWPNPLPQDAGMAAVALIRSGGKRPPLALAPHLASSLLAEREGYNDLAWETKCAFQRWWLLVSLAQGDTTAAALNAFRYGTLITATDRFGRQFESEGEPASKAKASARPGYPKLALHFDVTGSTKVSRWRDASGKPERASVTDRNITVRGIRGVRPVAFENTFDELAAQYALKGGAATPGNPEVFEMVWTLEPPAPATKAETKPQGASK